MMLQSFIGILLQSLGFALVTLGIFWILQGLGLLNWPADTIMYGKSEWALYGAIGCLAGALMIWIATRIKPLD
jgi:uncharacterized membrane protein